MATGLSARKTTWTPDDLLRITDGHRFELVGGVLVRRGMGTISSWAGGVLYGLLSTYCNENRAGWVFPADAGYTCFRGGRTVRYPDVSVVKFGRLPGECLPEGHLDIPPDLAVEVISPKDRAERLESKLRDYRAAGIPLVWVIYPATRSARVYRSDKTTSELGEDDTLSGETVLPGFTVRLGDLFPAPTTTPPA